MDVPETRLHLVATHRLIPSRYPPIGILDAIATPDDLQAIISLEGWTNDRLSAELGLLFRIPREEWVTGRPLASVVMAAFCHPHPFGSRFSFGDRGAWYASRDLQTAHAEIIHHRWRELAEIGVTDARLQMRDYIADFDNSFHDIRGDDQRFRNLHDSADYTASQAFARDLLQAGSNGVIYRSVRRAGGECLACFRPRLVTNARQGAHFEYVWRGGPQPETVVLAREATASDE